MKEAIYAGSFDPWSFGHQFVLESALRIFDRVHIVAAVNPAKPGEFDPHTRARAIAHSIDCLEDWWNRTPPFSITKNVVIAATDGLVVNYARSHGILHLIRGLRSTSDFEAEFNLYFANRAIHTDIQTWCIMCPPELLHCSSTFVRSVVGKTDVESVGTSFVNQSILLKKNNAAARILDTIQTISKYRFVQQPADLSISTLNEALQRVFLFLTQSSLYSDEICKKLSVSLNDFLSENATRIRDELNDEKYPEHDVHKLWAILLKGCTQGCVADNNLSQQSELAKQFSQSLGRTEIPLFNSERIRAILEESAL